MVSAPSAPCAQGARAVYRRVCAALASAGVPDAPFDASQLLTLAGAPDWRLQPDALLTAEAARALEALVRRRCAREPLQYLAGEWDFLDFTLAVGPGVLIPRADTEVVALAAAEAAERACAARGAAEVADLCSGTGAIALAVALRVRAARVKAVELSADALRYLDKNNAAHGGLLCVVQADVFSWQKALAPQSLDVLVCNPPYVTGAEMEHLAPELAFEPRMALEAPQQGLAFYAHIAPAYFFALRPGGMLIFEIGCSQAQAVTELCRAAGYTDVEVRQDLGGNPRAVLARRPGKAAL